jgi:hypothetical protein
MSSAERVRRSRWVNRLEHKADKLLELLDEAPVPLPRQPVVDKQLLTKLEAIVEGQPESTTQESPDTLTVSTQQVDKRKKRITKNSLSGSTYLHQSGDSVWIAASSDHQEICRSVLGEPNKEHSMESYIAWNDVSTTELTDLLYAISSGEFTVREVEPDQKVMLHDSLKDEVYRVVKSQAAIGKVISYASLSKQLGVIPPQLFKPLDDICKISMKESNDSFMLSAFVVGENKKNQGMPSNGFFNLAKEYGFLHGAETLPERYRFWMDQLTGLLRFYGENKQNSMVIPAVSGLKGSSEEAMFFERMRKYKNLEFIKRDSWDNSDQYRGNKTEKLPYQIYFDILDPEMICTGVKNASIIEDIVGEKAISAIYWDDARRTVFRLSEDEVNKLI